MKFWSIDFQGPLPTTTNGNRFLIVANDYGSKWDEAEQTKDQTAITTANFLLKNIILRHGPPDVIHTDQGANFESKLVNELCRLYNIKKSRSAPYHPEGNGAVERENRSIKDLLRPYTLENQRDWDQKVPMVINARNTTVHSSTGFTPYEMIYARKPNETVQQEVDFEPSSEYVAKLKEAKKLIEACARKRHAKQLAKYKAAYAKRHRINYDYLKPGDLVLITNEANHVGLNKRLEAKQIGPYTVARATSHDCIVENEDGSYRKAIHRSRLQRYIPPKVGREQPSSPANKPTSSSTNKQPSSANKPTSPQAHEPLKESNALMPIAPAPAQTSQPTYVTRYGRAIKPVNHF